MKRIIGEQITALRRQIGCSFNCAMIAIEFSDLDSGLSLEDKLSLARKRSMQYAGHDEVRAKELFSELLAKINPENK